ncbi:hypothetical protein PHLCEN_2v9145 [Hermanssonia centrifuga]|uniref:EthD domain-containing protein n=1 Tax=Hermanssonia centrifuga TaxID=98765 RepID=A0A2R6NRL3_9APHY|nr:hypothetical protein PHLCEN_2v9145 [Hermanssonia centrifuga]
MAIRIIGLIKRRPDITLEEFKERWGTRHAGILVSTRAVREKIVRYSQFHVLTQPSEALAAAGVPIAPYDGMAEMWVDKIEDLLELFQDEEFQKNVLPDEANFLPENRENMLVLVGEDQPKYERAE